jgi:hypothetical protein
VLFTADVGPPRRSSKDVEGDRLRALTERQISTRAMPCVGYWAAYYINRDGGWSAACDALGRIIRCETEKLALSVARYRRRRLEPLRGGSPKLVRTGRRHGRYLTASPKWAPAATDKVSRIYLSVTHPTIP